jgi:hypothetical protein
MISIEPKIKAAFIRGYLNKCASIPLEKKALISLLAPIIGGIGGDLLASRLMTGPLLRMAGRTLAARRAAGIDTTKGISNRLLRFYRSPVPGMGMRTGQLIGSGIGFGVGSSALSALVGNPEDQAQQPQQPQ